MQPFPTPAASGAPCPGRGHARGPSQRRPAAAAAAWPPRRCSAAPCPRRATAAWAAGGASSLPPAARAPSARAPGRAGRRRARRAGSLARSPCKPRCWLAERRTGNANLVEEQRPATVETSWGPGWQAERRRAPQRVRRGARRGRTLAPVLGRGGQQAPGLRAVQQRVQVPRRDLRRRAGGRRNGRAGKLARRVRARVGLDRARRARRARARRVRRRRGAIVRRACAAADRVHAARCLRLASQRRHSSVPGSRAMLCGSGRPGRAGAQA